jgi:hypothetical protein
LKLEKLDSFDEFQEIDQFTINRLFRDVFPLLSNLAIFNFAYFSVACDDDVDQQFRQALNHELFRRGLLEAPDSSLESVIVDKFTNEEKDAIDKWFACDPEEPTVEDRYVELLTDRDRWSERVPLKRKRRAIKSPGKNRSNSGSGARSDRRR